MFDSKKVVRLGIPMWQAVYKAEIVPNVTALIAIHDTKRGRALGGCRMAMYPDLAEALNDVLRLSRGMTFKNAVAELPLGGGKSVIVCDPNVKGADREAILEEFGKFMTWVNRDNEDYITAEDMNTTVADMHTMKRQTNFVMGTDVDPSPYTSWGVYCAIKNTVAYFAEDLFGGDGSLMGKKILLQGLGKVGSTLLDYLYKAGAVISVTDIRMASCEAAKERYANITIVEPDSVLDQEVDVLVPCAAGGLITSANVNDLKFKVLCGAANNQLQDPEVGAALQARGIVYCPDFIANMGGVCAIQYLEVEKLGHQVCLDNIHETVAKRLDQTFSIGLKENLAFNVAVDRVVIQAVWEGNDLGHVQSQSLFPKTSARVGA